MLRKSDATLRVVEPVFPARVERLLDGLRQAPERDAARGIEDLAATLGGDREHRAGQPIRSWKASLKSCCSDSSKWPSSVPPTR